VEEDLIKSEERFRSLIQNASDIITILDGKGCITYASPSFHRLLNLPPESELGRFALDYVHPGDREHVRVELEEVYTRQNTMVPTQYRILKGSGQFLDVESVGANLLDTPGVNGIVIATRDITERRKMEAALHASEKMQKAIIDHLPDATLAIDRNGVVIAWNRAMEELTGVAAKDMIGKGDYAYSVPIYGSPRPILADLILAPRNEIAGSYTRVVRSGNTLTGENPVSSIRGIKKTLWEKASPLFNENNEISGAIESIRDITDIRATETELQKRNEELVAAYSQITATEEELRQNFEELMRNQSALAESRQLLQSVLDALPVRVFWKDRDLRYLGCNRPFALDAGFDDPSGITGKTDFDMSWAGQAELYRSDDRGVIESGRPKLSYEEPQTTPEGSRIWLRTNKVPLRSTDGAIRGVLGTYDDITGLKAAQEEIAMLAQFPARNPNPVMRVDTDGKILYANPPGSRLITAWETSAASAVPALLKERVAAALREGVVVSFDTVVEGSSYAVTIAPYEREPVATVYFLDITARRRAEEAVERRNEEIFAAYQQLSASDTALREQYRLLIEKQKLLEENEEKYRNLFEAESDAIFLIDTTTGQILEANGAASQLYGYSRDELLGMRKADLSAGPEEAGAGPGGIPADENVIAIPHSRHRKKDGVVFPVEITGRFFVWNDRPMHIAAVRNTAARVEAETVEKERTERSVRYHKTLVQLATTDAPTLRIALQRITEAGADSLSVERASIWFMSKGADALICNDLYTRSRKAHASGQNLRSAEYPRYFDALHTTRAIVAPDAATNELVSEFRNGYLGLHAITSMLAIPVRSGKDVIGVLCFEQTETSRDWDIEDQDFAGALADYTAIVLEQARRRLAEKDLKKSEEQYRAVVDRANDGIIILQGGLLRFINPKAAEVFGTDPASLIGSPFTDCISPQERDRVLSMYDQRMAGSSVPEVYETSILKRDGCTVDVELNAGIITFEGKSADLIFIRDISGRKRSEQAIRLANQKLNLLSSITRHDILNKLTIAIGYLELAKMTHDREKLEDFIQKVDTTLQVMEEQIQFTRDYQDMGVKDPEWQDAARVFEQVASQLDFGTVKVENRLEGLFVFADPLFSKVLYNIVDNALRYGGTITSVTADYRMEGSVTVLSVRDDGVGIPAKDKGRIFDKGFGQHTGLGLFLVKEILSLTGIEIIETGFPRKGACFEIRIPEGRYRITGNTP
jgi:PAS domain S-box-containing protein